MRKKVIVSILSVAVMAVILLTLGWHHKTNQKPVSSTPVKYTYVALGDSITSEHGPSGSFTKNYSDYLSKTYSKNVNLINLGINGWASDDLLNALTTSGHYIDSVKKANLITVNIGSNDIGQGVASVTSQVSGSDIDSQAALQKTAKSFEKNYTAILQKVRDLNPSAILLVMNIYNLNPNLPGLPDDKYGVGSIWVPKFNEIISDPVTKDKYKIQGIADVYTTFGANMLTLTNIQKGDGDIHPSVAGCQAISDEFAKLTPNLNNIK
ncbi:MAG: GDSL-type esterase/lipase family protein [Bacillota bacterium]|nr:GDSL-type esterase/lipase family protein [Bacillota bacterium]